MGNVGAHHSFQESEGFFLAQFIGGFRMKRSFIFTFLLVFILTGSAYANTWQWWSVSLPTQSVEPTQPSWSSEPILPSQPSWSIDPIQPTQPSWSFEPTQPSQPLWPTEPTQPIEPTPPTTDPETPIEPIEPSTPENRVPYPNLSLTGEEHQLINQLNQERIKQGLKPLAVDMALVSIAKTKSHDMASNNYFSHVSPTLGTVYNMLDNAGITYSRAGENIARAGSVSRAHELFMNSSGHRANILHSGYTHIGVGIVKYGTSYHVTQVFIKK